MSFIEPGLFDMIVRLRSRGIFDTRVLRAMESIPRSGFIGTDLKSEAYEERELPIPCGQTMLPPNTSAIMLQSLDVDKTHKVLQIGTGSGYMTALLAALAKRVYGVERYKQLTKLSETNSRTHADNTVIRHGDGRYGWRGQKPFDRILVCGAMRIRPNALVDQLAPGGLMLVVIEDQLIVARKRTRKVVESQILPLSLPPLEPGKIQNFITFLISSLTISDQDSVHSMPKILREAAMKLKTTLLIANATLMFANTAAAQADNTIVVREAVPTQKAAIIANSPEDLALQREIRNIRAYNAYIDSQVGISAPTVQINPYVGKRLELFAKPTTRITYKNGRRPKSYLYDHTNNNHHTAATGRGDNPYSPYCTRRHTI